MEKRLFSRVIVTNCMCELTNNGTFNGNINNISLGGLNVTSNIHLSVRDMVGMSFSIPYFYMSTMLNACSNAIITDYIYKPIVINANASAVRIDNDGIGFKFVELSPEDFWYLQSFVHKASA